MANEVKNYILQLKRNEVVYDSKVTALANIKTQLGKAAPGEALISVYTANGVEHVFLGIKGLSSGYQIFEGITVTPDNKIEIPESVKEAVEALDLAPVGGNGKYIKLVSQTDGQLAAEAADLNAAAVAVTPVGDGSATNVQDVLEELDEAIGALEEKMGDESVEDQIEAALDELDCPETGGDGKIITKIKQENGKVTAESAPLTSSDKTVTIDGLDLIVNVDGSTIVKGSDGKLSVASNALTQYVGKEAIAVSEPDSSNNKTISLTIASGEKVLSQDASGLKSTLSVIKETTGLEANVKEQYKVVGIDGATALGETIKIYKDSALLSVKLLHADGANLPSYDKGTATWTDITSATESKLAICFAYEDVNGAVQIVAVPVGDFLRESEFKNGFEISPNGEVSVKQATDSEDFLVVDENGVAVKGVQDAIDAAKSAVVGDASENGNTLGKVEDRIESLESLMGEDSVESQIEAALDELDLTEVGGDGKYIKAVSQTDGQVAAAAVDLLASDADNALVSKNGSLYLSLTIDGGLY